MTTITISRAGVQGPAGVTWSTVNGGAWLSGTAYVRNAGVTRDGSSYRALVDHTAGAANAPGTGADWEEAWQVLALGSSVADVDAVAAIAAEIGVVAGISGDVTAVAAIAADATAVAGNAANVTAVAGNAANINQVAEDSAAINTAADNLAAIIAAPGAASAAAASALAAAASEDAAGDSATAAAGSAGAAASSEANAGDSAAAAAASAAAADADATQTAADVLSTASNLASAVAAKDLAIAAQGGAETAQAGADATKAAMDVALAAVTDYSDTLGLLTGGAKEIAAAADVVAAIIYDTTKDSDGGAWRKRCRHTSWYNETLSTATRGSRREFPQKALIVARAASVTIYDLDTAGCPMWMVFSMAPGTSIASGASTYCLAAMNGALKVGSTGNTLGRLFEVDFIADFSHARLNNTNRYFFRPSLVDRNVNVSVTEINVFAGSLANREINAVAMTVLPGTPIDPVRGLPNPTIAVGTAGGVSVIHWDGRVTSSASTTAVTRVSLLNDGLLTALTSTQIRMARPSVYGLASFVFEDLTVSTIPALVGSPAVLSGDIVASTSGLSRLSRAGFISRSAVAYVTNAYNTGHMVGDIKMALAESTADLTSLVEATPLNDDFSSYADTAAMLAAGWVYSGSAWATLDFSGPNVQVTGTSPGSGFQSIIYFPVPSVAGARYKIEFAGTATSGNVAIYTYGSGATTGFLGQTSAAPVGAFSLLSNVRATGANIWVQIAQFGTGAVDITITSIRVRRVAEDRSVAANHPIVKGTVTRAAVASGAELAAYGGFSAANYLEVPAGHSFTPGTSDFYAAVWFKASSWNTGDRLIEYGYSDGAAYQGALINIQGRISGAIRVLASDDGALTIDFAESAGINYADNLWHQVLGIRRGNVLEIWIDGVRMATDAIVDANGSLTNANASIRFGRSAVAAPVAYWPGNLALQRIGLTAPTPAQIRAIYEDERRLFAASAKCLLPGASVSALAYDDSTDLLHVATTAGSARLRGLLVVDKDATVYTGLDARDGILATRDSGSADIVLPSIPLREAAAAGIGHNGGPALYDRRTARASGVTTNATPTVIARFPMDKGEFGEWVIRTTAREYDGGAELAAYEDVLLARRPGEGNIAISGSVTQRVIQEVTSSMAVSVAANTTTQCIEVTATGVSDKNIEWSVEARLA